jgi:hypothetical protein
MGSSHSANIMETFPQETHQSYHRRQFYCQQLNLKPFSLQRTIYEHTVRTLLEKMGRVYTGASQANQN